MKTENCSLSYSIKEMLMLLLSLVFFKKEDAYADALNCFFFKNWS